MYGNKSITTKLSKVYAKDLGARISPKKVAPVADLVRGKNVHDAKLVLAFDPTKAAKMILKVVKSAEANAKHNNNITDELLISELWVGPGVIAKRGRIKAKSRFSPILKRTANIYVGLSVQPKKHVAAKKDASVVKKVLKGKK